MKHASRLIALAAVTLPFAAFAQSPGPDPSAAGQVEQKQSGGATFESLDTNSDGRISRSEAEANANVKAQFSSYDINGDGFIERAEVQQASQPKGDTPQQ